MTTKTHIASDETLKELARTLGMLDYDGTPEGYHDVMRRWFHANGALTATSAELTALCDEWYRVTRVAWTGGTQFYQPDVSTVTTGTKTGDNAEMTCEPSTDETQGTDDYAGHPLFAVTDCNWEMDADTLQPVITQIEGITTGFRRTDPDTLVGVLQMSGYIRTHDYGDYYVREYSSLPPQAHTGEWAPLREAVNPDGTVREWVLHAKYMASLEGTCLTSCAGRVVRGFLSHDTVHTYSHNLGTAYSGTCACDDAFLKVMAYVKYGSLTLDGIMAGCVSDNHQYPALVAEEGVTRVIVDSAASSYFEVGQSVLIGDYSSSTDRGSLYGTSGAAGCKVTSVETVTVDDTEYCAIGTDYGGTFDTGANGAATEGTTYVSSYGYPTGWTDCVLGNDGSPVSNTSGKYPCKLQGIEMMNGVYEIIADSILSMYADDDGDYWYEPYTCPDSASQSTSITSDYEASGALFPQNASSAAWTYIAKLSDGCNGVMFPTEAGGGSSTLTCDAFYANAATTGSRKWMARGCLTGGSYAGLSCVHGLHDLSLAWWGCGARLSAAGNRGEWTA